MSIFLTGLVKYLWINMVITYSLSHSDLWVNANYTLDCISPDNRLHTYSLYYVATVATRLHSLQKVMVFDPRFWQRDSKPSCCIELLMHFHCVTGNLYLLWLCKYRYQCNIMTSSDSIREAMWLPSTNFV